LLTNEIETSRLLREELETAHAEGKALSDYFGKAEAILIELASWMRMTRQIPGIGFADANEWAKIATASEPDPPRCEGCERLANYDDSRICKVCGRFLCLTCMPLETCGWCWDTKDAT
jgi:hypothetical protein